MNDIYTYIEKNGDNEIKRINYLDALIFARLSYVHIEELEDKLPFNIRDLNNYLSFIKISSKDKKLVNLLANSKRFSNLVITRCQLKFNVEKHEQFFGLTIKLPNNSLFIAFRGTDKSMAGFMEDMDMSYMTIPGQIDAMEYLNTEKNLCNIYLGGHSKGGNLALYALVNANIVKKLQVKKVYNFDGPGLLELDDNYYKVKKRIENFYPFCSIVGRMLYNDSKYIVFKTIKTGIEGHNIYNWLVEDKKFIETEFLQVSEEFNKEVKELLEKINIKRRKEIIENLYEITIKEKIDLRNFDLNKLKEIINSNTKINSDEKKVLTKFIKVIIKGILPFNSK